MNREYESKIFKKRKREKQAKCNEGKEVV